MLALAFLRMRREGGDIEVERVGLGGREHRFVFLARMEHGS